MKKPQRRESVSLKSYTTVESIGATNIPLEYSDLRQAVLVLRAVNHKRRQRIITLLEKSDAMTVTDMRIKLRRGQSATSQDLKILRMAYIVSTQRQGKFILYSLNRERLVHVLRLSKELVG